MSSQPRRPIFRLEVTGGIAGKRSRWSIDRRTGEVRFRPKGRSECEGSSCTWKESQIVRLGTLDTGSQLFRTVVSDPGFPGKYGRATPEKDLFILDGIYTKISYDPEQVVAMSSDLNPTGRQLLRKLKEQIKLLKSPAPPRDHQPNLLQLYQHVDSGQLPVSY